MLRALTKKICQPNTGLDIRPVWQSLPTTASLLNFRAYSFAPSSLNSVEQKRFISFVPPNSEDRGSREREKQNDRREWKKDPEIGGKWKVPAALGAVFGTAYLLSNLQKDKYGKEEELATCQILEQEPAPRFMEADLIVDISTIVREAYQEYPHLGAMVDAGYLERRSFKFWEEKVRTLKGFESQQRKILKKLNSQALAERGENWHFQFNQTLKTINVASESFSGAVKIKYDMEKKLQEHYLRAVRYAQGDIIKKIENEYDYSSKRFYRNLHPGVEIEKTPIGLALLKGYEEIFLSELLKLGEVKQDVYLLRSSSTNSFCMKLLEEGIKEASDSIVLELVQSGVLEDFVENESNSSSTIKQLLELSKLRVDDKRFPKKSSAYLQGILAHMASDQDSFDSAKKQIETSSWSNNELRWKIEFERYTLSVCK